MKTKTLFKFMMPQLIVSFGIAVVAIILVIQKDNTEKIEPIVYEITYETETNKLETIEMTEIEMAEQKMKLKFSELETIEDKKGWFLSYKDLVNEYKDTVDPPETIYDYYTEDEIYLIQRCVETECHGGDFESKANVASVIMNRIQSDKFDNTPKEVITEPNQFAYGKRKISEDTVLAVEFAFEIEDTTDGCLAFHSNKKTDKFYNWNYVFTDKLGHHFYK